MSKVTNLSFFDSLVNSAVGIVQEVFNTVKYYSNLAEARFNSWVDSFWKIPQTSTVLDHGSLEVANLVPSDLKQSFAVNNETVKEDITQEDNSAALIADTVLYEAKEEEHEEYSYDGSEEGEGLTTTSGVKLYRHTKSNQNSEAETDIESEEGDEYSEAGDGYYIDDAYFEDEDSHYLGDEEEYGDETGDADVSHLLPKGSEEFVAADSSDPLIVLETSLIDGTIHEIAALSEAEMNDFEQFSKEYDEDVAQTGAATLKDARKDHEEDEGFVEGDDESAETASSDTLNSAGLVWDNYEVITTTTIPYNVSSDTITSLFRACVEHYKANYQQPALVGCSVDSVIGDTHNPLIESEC